MSRRTFAAAAAVLAADAFIPGCRPVRSTDAGIHAALLTARPEKDGVAAAPGQRPLGLVTERDALLHVPAEPAGSAAAPGELLPLPVLLHGAGSDAAGGLSLLTGLADEYGLALVAPASRSGIWDAIRGGYEADVDHIDTGLRETFSAVGIDPERIGICGFSDGASYALGLGLANGDLFAKVIAFSHQPENCPRPRTGRIRRHLPGIRRRPHGPGVDCQ